MKITRNFNLLEHNTFGMDVLCSVFVEIEKDNDISDAVRDGLFQGNWFILGGGSNVLFTKNYDGTIFHPTFKGIEMLEENEDAVILRVAAGESWSNLTDYCLQNKFYGLENLIGIPGLVGSAPVQNIGAYGMEIKDTIQHVEGIRLDTGETFQLTNAECHFGYRDSIFKNELKGKCFITHVCFRLSKKPHFNLTYKALSNALEAEHLEPSLENIAQTVLSVRNSKLPDITKIGCAGSFFKNPIVEKIIYEELLARVPDLVSYPVDEQHVKLAAGQLIDKAGWKGKQIGNAGIYPKQALVVVNFGGAKPEEISNVYQRVIFDVKQQFGIQLSPEVNIL